jgi:hypothetical protein
VAAKTKTKSRSFAGQWRRKYVLCSAPRCHAPRRCPSPFQCRSSAMAPMTVDASAIRLRTVTLEGRAPLSPFRVRKNLRRHCLRLQNCVRRLPGRRISAALGVGGRSRQYSSARDCGSDQSLRHDFAHFGFNPHCIPGRQCEVTNDTSALTAHPVARRRTSGRARRRRRLCRPSSLVEQLGQRLAAIGTESTRTKCAANARHF